MRIIAGEFRGRPLFAPRGQVARPTTDRLRERIFNILEHGDGPALSGARVADVFAGTGAMGLEALSRGARSAVFVEKHSASLDAVRHNISRLGVENHAEVLVADARRLPAVDVPFDLIFMDPPYGRDLEGPALQSMVRRKWISPRSVIVLELPHGQKFEPTGFEIKDRRTQGNSEILIIGLTTPR